MKAARRQLLLGLKLELLDWLLVVISALPYVRYLLACTLGLVVGLGRFEMGAYVLLTGAYVYLALLLTRLTLYWFLYWTSYKLEKNPDDKP